MKTDISMVLSPFNMLYVDIDIYFWVLSETNPLAFFQWTFSTRFNSQWIFFSCFNLKVRTFSLWGLDIFLFPSEVVPTTFFSDGREQHWNLHYFTVFAPVWWANDSSTTTSNNCIIRPFFSFVLMLFLSVKKVLKAFKFSVYFGSLKKWRN